MSGSVTPVIVLVTVTDTETGAVMDAFLGDDIAATIQTIGGVTYFHLGMHGGNLVIQTVCEMGQVGMGAAIQRTLDAIAHWQPRAVIAVGIAFGLAESKQKLGDVLVSRQIQDYELGRVNRDGSFIARGDRATAADRLLNRIRQLNVALSREADAKWPKLHFGMMLSGQKLVDSSDWREKLLAMFPEAVGGEMEGAGIYGAAVRAGVDWIVVKAISDWGHGKRHGGEDLSQQAAAANAAKVVAAAIRLPGLYVDSTQPSKVTRLFLHAAPELQRERDQLEQALPPLLARYQGHGGRMQVMRWEQFLNEFVAARRHGGLAIPVVQENDIFVNMLSGGVSEQDFLAAHDHFAVIERPRVLTFFADQSGAPVTGDLPVSRAVANQLAALGHTGMRFGGVQDLQRQLQARLDDLAVRGCLYTVTGAGQANGVAKAVAHAPANRTAAMARHYLQVAALAGGASLPVPEKPKWALEQRGYEVLIPVPWGAPQWVVLPPAGSGVLCQAPVLPRVGATQITAFTVQCDSIGLFAQMIINDGDVDSGQGFRYILPGEFVMGSPPAETARIEVFNDEVLAWLAREQPQHRVEISQGFWLADTACRQGLWLALMGENPAELNEEAGGSVAHPVEQVSWLDVQAFLQKLTAHLAGAAATLPTEAEWEYACRAGTTSAFWFGETISPAQVNYDGQYPYGDGVVGEYRAQTVAVTALAANGWGLYQMHGNVWEWCADGVREYRLEDVCDPGLAEAWIANDLLADDARRVLRGGSWFFGAPDVRSALRGASVCGLRDADVGFRLALRFPASKVVAAAEQPLTAGGG